MSGLVARARASIHSARLILDTGDTNGAISRAYYGMFDVARAALWAVDPKLIVAKTHATIISRFSRHVVREKGLSPELGRALRRAHDLRLVTEYSKSMATKDDARGVVEAAEQFLAAVTKAIVDDC
jgi:uncharacterized protein (UPF0332 family)